MDTSFETIRDTYKNSRQSSDIKIGVNGATLRRRQFTNTGDFIFKEEHNGKTNNNNNNKQILNEIDRKYEINATNVPLSLNKKNRWNLKNDIYFNMNDYNQNDLDVRFYESRSTVDFYKPECLSFYHSKVNEIDPSKSINSNIIKSGKGNLLSIKKQIDIDQIRRNEEKKKLRFNEFNDSIENTKKNSKTNKKIGNSAVNDSEYIEYNVEYNSMPNKKSSQKKAYKFSIKNTDNRKTIPNKARNFNYYNITDEDLSEFSDTSDIESYNSNEEKTQTNTNTMNVDFFDLITPHSFGKPNKNSKIYN